MTRSIWTRLASCFLLTAVLLVSLLLVYYHYVVYYAIPMPGPEPERLIASVYNFRDLGGIRNRQGAVVRSGIIYRSSALDELDNDALNTLLSLHISEIFDFRAPAEVQEAPDRLPDTQPITYTALPIDLTRRFKLDETRDVLIDASHEHSNLDHLMIAANEDMVLQYTPVYRAFFARLLQRPDEPFVFHCTAGKDRTGLAAALLLAALDVPGKAIMEDYLSSNRFSELNTRKTVFWAKLASLNEISEAPLRSLLSVKPQYLEAAFKAIDEHYGNLDNYLHTGLDLDVTELKTLRQRYLSTVTKPEP